MKPKIAIILFPGTNCEEETKQAAIFAGMDADIIKWNEDPATLESYEGYVLPGGWSYEDRIRAGVIASKDKIMQQIKKEAEKGKPVIGICNGCQVLVESGLIPGIKIETQMALAPNINPKVSGFYCVWTNLKTNKKSKNAFTVALEDEEVIPMPIAHGEGRFTTTEKGLLDSLIENGQIIFQYSDADGKIEDSFPTNPNGSELNIAGISNKEGNVLALMPHPERASWKRQLPEFENQKLEDMESAAPSLKLFESMKRYIQENES